MTHDVITLPLRTGISAARLGIRVLEQTVTFGLGATKWLIETAVRQPGEPVDAEPMDTEPVPDGPVADATAGPAEPVAPPPRPVEPPVPDAGIVPEPPPAHVSREAELVEEFADPGAEEGAGATVHIEEPWEGYGHMTADEVIERLVAVSREELAAVALYEGAHRDRKTVLEAAQRRLREESSPARRAG
jgi:hypothetical protein